MNSESKAYAECGLEIVTVEHGSLEMPGLMSLRDHLAGQFPMVEFTWIAEHPRTWTVKARREPSTDI